MQDIAVVTWITTIVTDDVTATRDHLRRGMAMTVCAFHRELRQMLGIDDGRRSEMQHALEHSSGPFSPELFPDSLFDQVAIVGSAGHCIERLRAIEAAGSTQYSVRMPVAAAALVDLRHEPAGHCGRNHPEFQVNDRVGAKCIGDESPTGRCLARIFA